MGLQEVLKKIRDRDSRTKVATMVNELLDALDRVDTERQSWQDRYIEESLRLAVERKRVSRWNKFTIFVTAVATICSIVFIWIRATEIGGAAKECQKLKVENIALRKVQTEHSEKIKELELKLEKAHFTIGKLQKK